MWEYITEPCDSHVRVGTLNETGLLVIVRSTSPKYSPGRNLKQKDLTREHDESSVRHSFGFGRYTSPVSLLLESLGRLSSLSVVLILTLVTRVSRPGSSRRSTDVDPLTGVECFVEGSIEGLRSLFISKH